MAENTVSTIAPIVNENSEICINFIDGKTPVVSSLHIARHFHKKHKEVLRDIYKIISITPKLFIERNFALNEYTDSIGRSLPAYSLTRDAFSLLAMGFTGSAAIRWKLKYIEAFNDLEKTVWDSAYQRGLTEARQHPALEADRKAAYLSGMQEGTRLQKRRDGLKRLVKVREYIAKGLTHSEIGKILGVTRQAVTDTLARARKAGLCA